MNTLRSSKHGVLDNVHLFGLKLCHPQWVSGNGGDHLELCTVLKLALQKTMKYVWSENDNYVLILWTLQVESLMVVSAYDIVILAYFSAQMDMITKVSAYIVQFMHIQMQISAYMY